MIRPLPGRGGELSVDLSVDLGVPAYIHPGLDPRAWAQLAAVAADLRFVVVNVGDGVGERSDPAYTSAIAGLRRAGVRLVGYVDTDYGRRPVDDVVAEAGTWVSRYGVAGVFLDQVRGDFAWLQHYASCSVGARTVGAQFVVLNPGTACDPGYVDVANVVVTFEGAWTRYTAYEPPGWTTGRPARRFCHLVYDVPPAVMPSCLAEAARRHAGTAYFTTAGAPNPWNRLPAELAAALARAAAIPDPSPGVETWTDLRRYASTLDLNPKDRNRDKPDRKDRQRREKL